MTRGMSKLTINGKSFSKRYIASLEVDPMNCFTSKCMGELPIVGGEEIVAELNAQAEIASKRTFSKDAHPLNAYWVVKPAFPQLSLIPEKRENMDVHWNIHGVPGTYGFELIDGLPPVSHYDFFVYKGVERDMHPYGACYHDHAELISTGLIEWYRCNGIKVIIVGGLATDYCVKLTVLQLLRANFIVVLNLGACRGISLTSEENAIEEMRRAGAITAWHSENILRSIFEN